MLLAAAGPQGKYIFMAESAESIDGTWPFKSMPSEMSLTDRECIVQIDNIDVAGGEQSFKTEYHFRTWRSWA